MATSFSVIVRAAVNVGITPNATFDDFNEGTDKLRHLNHHYEKYVLAIFLLDFSKSGQAVSIEMQGFLVNTETGAVEWSDSGDIKANLNDPAYKIFGDNPIYKIFRNAVTEMMQSFPNFWNWKK
jgi:hypothetical protein